MPEPTFDELIYRLGHDLRGPVLNLKMALDVFVQEQDPDARRSMGQLLMDEMSKLDGMIEGMLEYSRAHRLQPLPSRPGALLHQLLSEVSTRKEVETRIEDVGEVRLDPDRLFKALSQAWKNAVRAAKTRVRISLSRAGDAVRICFEDDGAGVPPDMREKVFEPLYSGWREGLGLGLSTIRKMAETLGGKAYLEDSDLGGASLVLELPAG